MTSRPRAVLGGVIGFTLSAVVVYLGLGLVSDILQPRSAGDAIGFALQILAGLVLSALALAGVATYAAIVVYRAPEEGLRRHLTVPVVVSSTGTLAMMALTTTLVFHGRGNFPQALLVCLGTWSLALAIGWGAPLAARRLPGRRER